MAKNNKGQDGKKKAAKGDHKAAAATKRKFAVHKINGSKGKRGCTPIAKKLAAEHAFNDAHKGDKWLQAEMRGNKRSSRVQTDLREAAKDLRFARGEEKPIATSASFYEELAAAFNA